MEKYRHGDVLIERIEKLPPKKNLTEQKHLTLAEGEVTGHSHRISEGAGKLFKFDDRMFLKVQSEIATLVHEEHHALTLPQGDYEIKIQREYSPEGWRRVQD